MGQWLQSHIQTIVYILVFAIPALSKGIQVIAEKRREAEARRARGESPTMSMYGQPTARRAEAAAQNREPATIQDELAAQRQAQIEMWKAREAAMRGQAESMPVQPRVSAEDELALRRRLAMEELRRRQVEVDRMRSQQASAADRPRPQSAQSAGPMTRRQRAQAAEAERRRQAAQRRGVPAPSSPRQVVEQVIASLPSAPAEEPVESRPLVVPPSMTSPAGGLILSQESLRQAFIMKELLDLPIALRDYQS